ncbi:MAG: flagellar basal-body rod protein FlgB [Thermotogota bacterium]|nr:flagellar basal-body rod protein FlgB [Thermotogota bacterium]MDK2864751.1 flagellar basal-body rod protein FlgB [Thermotogota bacterium]
MFGLDYQLLKIALDVSALRAEVIANNIANVETPNYKRKYVVFESALQEAMEDRHIQLKRTNPKHLTGTFRISPQVMTDWSTSMRNDGNNVDIDREMTELASNTLRYQVLTSLTSRLVERYNVVLRGVR